MFQIPQPTTAKLVEAKSKYLQLGEKDGRDGISIKFSVNLPNSALAMFDPALREVLYGAGSPGAKQSKQAALDGVEPVTDRPALTRTGQHLHRWTWDDTQTGCTLFIDAGRMPVELKDGTVKGMVVTLNEGGTIRVQFEFHAPVDHLTPEQGWNLAKTRKQEVTITLEGPAVNQLQADIEDEEEGETPESALAGSLAGDGESEGEERPDTSNPLPGQEVGAGVTVTHKKSRRAAAAAGAA
jgi:hypothetical protein